MTVLAFMLLIGLLKSNPIIFSQRYTADAAVIVYDGRVYVYGSHDVKGQDGFKMDGYTCFSSDDLLNWTDHGEVLKADQIPYVDHFWAPQAIYSEANNKFYLYFCQDHIGTGVVESDSPLGPWTDVRGSLLMEGHRVDVGVFIDDDGTPYAYWPGGIVKKLKQNMYEFEEGEWNVWNEDAHEAPYVRKINGKYYFFYMTFNDQELWSCAQFNVGCEDTYPWANFFHRYHFLESPTGPIIEPTSIHGRTMTWPLVGDNTHPAIFNFNGQYYSFYHSKLLQVKRNEPGFHRNIGLDRIYFDDDGHIIPQAVTQEGLRQVKYLNPYIRQQAETIGREERIQTEPSTDEGGGRMVTHINTHDWIKLFGVDFGSGATSFEARVASPAPATMEVRLDSVNGKTVSVLQIPDTGGLTNWQTVTASVSGAEGVHDLFFVFTLGGFHFNWWMFEGSGPSQDVPPPVVKRVSLQSFANDLFVTANESQLLADAYGVSENQQFSLIDNEDGTYSLRSIALHKFVTTTPNGLQASADNNNSDAERFLLMHSPNGSYCLFSQSKNIYVYAPENATQALTAGIDEPWKDPYRSVSRFWINYLDEPANQVFCTGESTPYKYHTIPGVIEAEDFDISCTEPGYFDTSHINAGNSYRPNESVDIRPTRDSLGQYDVFNILSEEWLGYTVFVEDSGYYEFSARFSATSGGHRFYIETESDVSEMIEVNHTGNVSNYQEFGGSVFIAAGKQQIRIVFDKSSRGLNFNFITFTKQQNTSANKPDVCPGLIIFPNPVERHFRIKYHSAEIQRVTLFDVNGNVVFTVNDRFIGDRNFDVSYLASGSYIVHVEMANGRKEKKILKI